MNLTDPRFQDAEKAREWLELQRWPSGPTCPHCGNADPEKITSLKGKAHRAGLYQCAECREQFTVMVGTVMERSKIPLNKWVAAMHLMGASKKGMSAHQLHRMLEITYQSAWFLAHRIREAMRDDGQGQLGGKCGSGIVEADETYFGEVENRKPSKQRKGRPYTKGGKSGPGGKRAVVSLVERGGRVRSFHPATADGPTVAEIVRDNIERETRLHTDESKLYIKVGREFTTHETVTHSHGEYVRGDVHTNSVEGYFSIFKRGMKGIYQHCKEKHLHRYLAEFDFRYNNRIGLGIDDTERTSKIVRQAEGKRLTYRRPHSALIPFPSRPLRPLAN